jgi:predicted MPP superfamily phosphohydrolase
MFHTLITLAYTIPGVYLFIRIWQLFIPAGKRIPFVLTFIFIFAIYPLSNFIGEGSESILAKILSGAANYLLPFFLYVFLLVLLTDMLLLINLAIGIIPKERVKDKSKMGKVFFLIIFLALTIVGAGIINFNTIRRTEYSITVPGRSSQLKTLRIAFVSDFHLQEGVPVRFVERFVKEIEAIKPDLMLFGGDIVEGDREGESMLQFEKLISGISTTYGVYGALGNHEHYSRQEQGGFFRRAGIEILTDTVIIRDHLFSLAGRNDSHTSSRKSAEAVAFMAPDSLPLIMIDHRPTEIAEIGKTKTDIVISGHTHHGQLFPINLITSKVYRLSYGYLKEGGANFFVSSGIRLWGFPVRTTAKSEIVVIDVKFSPFKKSGTMVHLQQK